MDNEVLDLDEFMERVQDDKELLLELLDIFEADYEVKRQDLEKAIEGGDFQTVSNIAHSLKGASGNISAKALRESFYKLEDMGKAEDLKGAGDLLEEIDKHYTNLKNQMQEIRNKLK